MAEGPAVVVCQILETQAALMKAQSEDDTKSGNTAAEARRWTGVRTIVEARSLLKTLFRAAAGHKAQARCSMFPMQHVEQHITWTKVFLFIARR